MCVCVCDDMCVYDCVCACMCVCEQNGKLMMIIMTIMKITIVMIIKMIMIHKVCVCIQKSGYNIWIDYKDMKGSLMDSMAEAVEGAAVVLLCMSAKYKDSANCKRGKIFRGGVKMK